MSKVAAGEELVGLVDKRYTEGKSYLRSRGFLDAWPLYERMKAGDQWPPATARTKSLPRPVFNIIDFISNHKVSTVMNENVKMLFSPQEAVDEGEQSPEALVAIQAAESFTRYSDTVWELIKQDELNEEALESASNSGTGIWHYYWDSSVKGGMTMPWIGEMQGETLDPINVFFGNPQQRRVQKQPFVIITHREMVDSVREEAMANGLSRELVSTIQGDSDQTDEGYDGARKEVGQGTKVTVKTMYWREDGQVMFCRTAGSQLVKKPTFTGFKSYPLVVMQWKRRKKSIHGIGDAEGIVPNQRAINLMLAMSVYSSQLTGWPKMKINPAYVDPNQINNDPSVPLIDRSPQGETGADYMTPGQMSPHIPKLIDSFIDYTKTLSSAQDAATGDMQSGNLNASAIMLLQKAAGVPIESIKKRFYRAMEDVGRVWEEFWKTKYNTARRVAMKDDEGEGYAETFRGTDYADIGLNLKIDIGPSSSYSEQLMMASLDKLYEKQAISTEQYLRYAPKNVVPFKDRLLKELEEQMQQQQQAEAMSGAQQADPQAEAAAQLEQQLAIKEREHEQRLELEQVKGQNAQAAAAAREGTR
ncbi:hypothetical protein ACTHPH_24000 [Paenibacillus pasadenensis]|uniref:portal protein n=1 Tax=Paenibacillus pasadenensis TaxID=217090 RepID=UPI00041CD707|nr:hypothetical protein [Paenibacillus pasadenensis]